MIRALVLGVFLALTTPVFAGQSVIDTGNAVKSYKLAGQVMTCQGADIVIDNTIPSEGAGTPGRRLSNDPKNGTIILNLRMMKRLAPPTQWFIFSHECGHLFGLKVTETRADRYGVWKGVDEGWLKVEHLQGICESFDLDAPAINDRENGSYYPSGRQRCKNVKGWFAEFDAKQKAYEAKVAEMEAARKQAESLNVPTEVTSEVK